MVKNGSFVALSVIIATFVGVGLSGRALEWFGFKPTTMNSIIAGALIGLPVCIACQLLFTLIAYAIRKNK